MNKLLIICGPTATGKTELAYELAVTVDGELLSADSRQIYKGLDLLTGKDLPEGSAYSLSRLTTNFHGTLYHHGYFRIKGTKLWLVDEMNIYEQFTVAHYQKFARTILCDMFRRKMLPIVVGGTGLYINSLIAPYDTISIPPNTIIREKYSALSVPDLQDVVRKFDSAKFYSMNHSDQHNPRRLIRAIETASWVSQKGSLRSSAALYASCIVGLTASMVELEKRIYQRILTRWNEGVVEEVKSFLADRTNKVLPTISILGLEHLIAYIDGSCTKEKAIRSWLIDEVKYAKRQVTWFKKQKDIHWFDITKSAYKQDILSLVSSWYTTKV